MLAKRKSNADELWKVFLVEDDMDDQKLAVRVLEQSPQLGEIICISDSARLFERLEKEKYLAESGDGRKVLIVLDIHMPGVDGLALLEQLRSNPYTCAFPVVMITGDKERDRIYQSYQKNASCFIAKPLMSSHLATIHTVLEYGNDWLRSVQRAH